MKVVFELNNVDESLLAKMPSGEKLAAYKKAKEAFEANGAKGESPVVPALEQYKPLQLVELVCVKAIKDNCKTGKPDQLNHLMNLFNTLSIQSRDNTDSFDLPETDVRFIRKSIAKTSWPTDNELLMKFVLMVEKCFANAVNNKK